MLAVDTETHGLDQYADDFRVFMATWADAAGEHVCDENTGFQPLLDAIAGEDVLLFANASFDIHALREDGVVDLLAGPWRCHDVQTLARVVVPGRYQYKLEGLGETFLGKDATEQQRALKDAAKLHGLKWTLKEKDYYGLWKLEPALMERYAKEDVRLTYDLWEIIWRLASPADIEVYRMEIADVAPLLREAERDGVLVDKERLAKLKARLEEERDELHCQLLAQGISQEALGGAPVLDTSRPGDVILVDGELVANPDYVPFTIPDAPNVVEAKASSKALLADLLSIGIPLYRKTPKSGAINEKTGKRNPDQLAVNKDALNEFKLRFPVVADLLAWRSANQILRTYVGALEKANPRIHTSFSQAEARTSRMSASRPNMQNLPAPDEESAEIGVRDVLVPGPDMAFIVGDYSNIEVFMLAHYIADDQLTADLNAGLDFYARTASLVYGYPYADCVKGGKYAAERQKSKTTTLTAMYGGGARLLGTRLGVSTAEAAEIKRETLDAIPGYWELDDRVKRAVQRRAFPHVVSILGRRLYVPRDKPYVALNTILQGSSAEIMKLGMIAAAPAIAPLDYAVRLVVHDELVAEGPACNAPAALITLKRAMESVYPLRPALKVSGDWSTDSYGSAK